MSTRNAAGRLDAGNRIWSQIGGETGSSLHLLAHFSVLGTQLPIVVSAIEQQNKPGIFAGIRNINVEQAVTDRGFFQDIHLVPREKSFQIIAVKVARALKIDRLVSIRFVFQ